jgi:Zn-dependent protease with chaperone function
VNYVVPILFALASLALLELGWANPGELPWVLVALVPLPYFAAWATRALLLRGRFRLGALLERLLALSPVLMQFAAVGVGGWIASLARLGRPVATFDEWLGLDVLWALIPFFVYQVLAIDARARLLTFPPDEPGRVRAFQGRLFFSALLPFAAYLAGSSLIARTEHTRVVLEEVSLLGGLATVLLFFVFLRGMPFFLRYAWDTTPVPKGWPRTVLENVARAAGFHYRELLVWRTGQQMANAAIVGFSPNSRFVFFSDLLLQQLGPRELAAVFAHEMGHARRAHATVFGAFALGFFLGGQQLIEAFELTDQGALLAAFGVLLLLWYLAFGYLSRRFELEADLESMRVVGDTASLVRALELVTGAHAHEKSSWRHFSTAQRVEFLHAAERDPLVGLRLKLTLARWRRIGFALFGLAACFTLVDLGRAWNQDWLVADLRLGAFERAAERAEEEGVEPEWAKLARLAVEVGPEERTPQALERRGSRALIHGDVPRAREWYELAVLRGSRTLDEEVATLRDAEERGAGIDGLPQEWRDALRALGRQ